MLNPKVAYMVWMTCLGLTLPSQAQSNDYRPSYHFTPDQYWMNEPNGLIKIGSTWHLFFQHNPTANVWGNICWGHATSTDLMHWAHKPTAIADENGVEAFTGTAYYDPNNTSGLGIRQTHPIWPGSQVIPLQAKHRTSAWLSVWITGRRGPNFKATPSYQLARKHHMI